MADKWKSDWEKLLAKCAADEDYRKQLSDALIGGDDSKVATLLTNIDLGGSADRIKALKDAYYTMNEVRKAFNGEDVAPNLAAAP